MVHVVAKQKVIMKTSMSIRTLAVDLFIAPSKEKITVLKKYNTEHKRENSKHATQKSKHRSYKL